MNANDVGRFISELRKANSLTQKELAERLNVTDKAVSKWETGKCYPDIEMIEKLSDFFEVSINDILSGKLTEPQEREKEADKNIVDVMKSSRRSKSKWQTAVLILGIVVFIIGIFTLYQTLTAPKAEIRRTVLQSQEAYDIFDDLNNTVYGEFGCTEETVVTDLTINFDEKNKVEDLTLSLWDWRTLKSVKVSYLYFEESKTYELLVSSVQMAENLNLDGIPLKTLSKFFSTQDISKLIITQSNLPYKYTVNFDNTMYMTVNENEDVGIAGYGYSYLYKDGEIKRLTNLSQLEGKIFEIAVFIPDGILPVSSCCLIHVPR